MINIDKWLQNSWNCKPLTESSVRHLCNMVKNVLVDESNIVVVDAPVNIVGDIRGQFFDVKEMFKQGGGIPQSKFILMGNFVGRGYNCVQTITLLFCLKVKYPKRIFLLRGNHQCRNMTTIYGFQDQINKKYGNFNCWKYFIEAFDYLPLGAVVHGQIFCVHGGMSPDLPCIDQIRLLDRKQQIPHEGPIADLMWGDPQNIDSWKKSPKGAGWIFENKVVEYFNHLNDIDLIVRSHQSVNDGYFYWFSEKLVTLWSAPNFRQMFGNKASILCLDENLKRDFLIFETVPESSTSKHYSFQLPYFL